MIRTAARLTILLACALTAPIASAQAASIWTPIATGTTQTISAIAVPQAGQLVFSTTAGQIRYLDSSGFVSATVTPAASSFTDLAMSSDGTKAVAVGTGGAIYFSADSGHTWNATATVTEYHGSCPGAGTETLADDLYSVQFADASTVYVTGNNNDVLKSTDAGAHFTEVNKNGTTCVAAPGTSVPFTDSQWIDANHGFLITNDFGSFYGTSNGMTSATAKTGAVNGFSGTDALALDPADPTRLWATNPGAQNGSYFSYTTDSGNTWNTPTYDRNQSGLEDVAAGASGSSLGVVAVGLGGDIYTSPDGRTFYRQVADAPNNTNDWHAVAMLGAGNAFVGGANGVLLATSQANQTPDTTAPTGTISGPRTLVTGQFGGYSVAATDNPGGSGVDPASYDWSTPGLPDQTGHPTASFAFSTTGTHTITVTFKDLAGNIGTATLNVSVTGPTQPPSGTGPVTTTTGGGTVTGFSTVTVTGRKGRFIPVSVSTKGQPRKFVISLLPAKGSKPLSMTAKTLGKHQKATVHLSVPASVKTGSYRLRVQIFTTGRHPRQLGKTISLVFILK